jgi:hypothetical protein
VIGIRFAFNNSEVWMLQGHSCFLAALWWARARLRLQAALATGTSAALIVVFLLTVALAAWRLTPGAADPPDLLWALAAGVVLLAGLTTWALYRPTPFRAALALDRHGGLQEKLSTCVEGAETNTQADERVLWAAQRRQAEQAATTAPIPRALPLAIPAWGRLIGVGLLLLGSVWLMPGTPPNSRPAGAMGADGQAAEAVAGTGEGTPQPLGQPTSGAFRVKVLPPNEVLKYELLAQDEMLPPEVKAAFLAELESKLAGMPESDLDSDILRIRDTLRASQPQDSASGKEGQASAQSAGQESREAGAAVAVARWTPPPPPRPAQVRAFAREAFPDVEPFLVRYYSK